MHKFTPLRLLFLALITTCMSALPTVAVPPLPQQTPPAANQLLKDLPLNFALKTSQQATFFVEVPSGVKNLTIRLSGDGDADLYVSHGFDASFDHFDCRPYLSDSNEKCTFATPKLGKYSIMVDGYAAAKNLTLVATWDGASSSDPLIGSDGRLISDDTEGHWQYFSTQGFTNTAGSVKVTLEGDNGDANLYISDQGRPTPESAKCTSAGPTSNEKCEIFTRSETVFIAVKATKPYQDIKIKAISYATP